MVPLGRAESWPFLHLFEHGVRNLCACERLRTIDAVFFFYFCCLALSSSVFLASNCEECWGMRRTLILGCANSSLKSWT